MQAELETAKKIVDEIVYHFYRYEIKNGMGKLEGLISEIARFVANGSFGQQELDEFNRLLEIILTAVEKKDFLIAADLLKYELMQRMLPDSRSAD